LIVAVAGTGVAFSTFRERATVTPVETPESSPVPDLAVVVCDGRNTKIVVGAVVARPDGVRVEVRNTSDHTLAFAASDTDEFADVPPGTSRLVESFFFDPGWHFVACGPKGRLPGGFEVQIHVVDPNGVWASWQLACPGSKQWGSRVHSPPSETDPIVVARKALGDRIHEGDALQFAGYPDHPEMRVVLLERDGEAIAEVWLKLVDGDWVGTSMNGCP
jgi:hypothetical protein